MFNGGGNNGRSSYLYNGAGAVAFCRMADGNAGYSWIMDIFCSSHMPNNNIEWRKGMDDIKKTWLITRVCVGCRARAHQRAAGALCDERASPSNIGSILVGGRAGGCGMAASARKTRALALSPWAPAPRIIAPAHAHYRHLRHAAALRANGAPRRRVLLLFSRQPGGSSFSASV